MTTAPARRARRCLCPILLAALTLAMWPPAAALAQVPAPPPRLEILGAEHEPDRRVARAADTALGRRYGRLDQLREHGLHACADFAGPRERGGGALQADGG